MFVHALYLFIMIVSCGVYLLCASVCSHVHTQCQDHWWGSVFFTPWVSNSGHKTWHKCLCPLSTSSVLCFLLTEAEWLTWIWFFWQTSFTLEDITKGMMSSDMSLQLQATKAARYLLWRRWYLSFYSQKWPPGAWWISWCWQNVHTMQKSLVHPKGGSNYHASLSLRAI